MAGAYPDPPNHRLAYDRDGSAVVRINADDSIDEISGGTINDEDSDSISFGNSSGSRLAILTPEMWNLDSYFIAITGSTNPEVDRIETSDDTTNGLDGTWTVQDSSPPHHKGNVSPHYREQINSLPVSGIRAVRFRFTTQFSQTISVFACHLYGTYDSAAPALALWDPDVDQRIDPAHLDWGDVQQGTSDTKRLRVKNTSADMLAEGVTLTDEVLTDTSPTYVGQHDFSADDGGTFADPLDIGDLSPGEISGEILLRRNLANDATLGVWALRILAEATAWSETT